jgi:hypothetical protein
MFVRNVRLPVVTAVCLTVGLLTGAALLPVAAQQQSGVDGQVAVRSDGAVYLITGGQRRWVATVMITDAEINAYPEAEPIYGGLAPIGGAASPAAPAASPSPAAPGSAASPTLSAPPASGAPSATTAVQPAAVDPNSSVQIDIDGSPKFEAGDVIKLEVKTAVGATCELTARFPDGSEVPQPSKAADGRGRCGYNVDIPATVPVGAGLLRATVRSGGLTSQGELPFEIVPAS